MTKLTSNQISKPQELIDFIFAMGLTIHNSQFFKNKTNEEVAIWIAEQLRQIGYDTEPIGSSWGFLKIK